MSFSDEVATNFLSPFDYDQKEKNQIKPSYENMLKDKDYKQLIELSFYDVDFHTPGDVLLSESSRQYWVKPADWNSTLWKAQRHQVFSNMALPTQLIITEVNAKIRWAVNKVDWNGWSKMTQ